MDELNPYEGMPAPSEQELIVPQPDPADEDVERSFFMRGIRDSSHDGPVRGERGSGRVGRPTAGQREGGALSAQVMYL